MRLAVASKRRPMTHPRVAGTHSPCRCWSRLTQALIWHGLFTHALRGRISIPSWSTPIAHFDKIRLVKQHEPDLAADPIGLNLAHRLEQQSRPGD